MAKKSSKPVKKTTKKVQNAPGTNKDKSKPEKPILMPQAPQDLPKVENEDIVLKKNTAGLKGKKKWAAKIDTQLLEKQIEEKHDKQRKIMQEQNQKSLDFQIDVEPQGKKDQGPLDKDRFKKKDFEKTISKKLLRKIEQKAKHVEESQKQKELQDEKTKQTKLDSRNYDEKNVWEEQQEVSTDPLVQPPKIKKNKFECDIKRVVLPTSGISYNPSASAYNKLVQEAIVDQQIRDNEVIVHTRSKKFDRELENQSKNLKRKKAKSQKVRYEQDMAEIRRKEKQFNHQFLNIKNIKKELQSEEKAVEEARLLQKQRDEDEEFNKKTLGIVGSKRGKKLGNKKYEYKREIFLEDEIPDNLKNINVSQDIVRDQFDSIFRRGLLESRNYNNKNKGRVAPRKNYGKYRSLKEGEDDWMNEQKDTLPSDMVKNNKPIAVINK